ncbi:MAG: DUF2059 domain-containing protein [Candidatus Omnitrophica bacterium]|nr:DUF2059 domain-containing protein [Candidatus Omnitrophota bacterium]
MKKTLVLVLLMVLAVNPFVYAEVIVLSDGTTINGKIVGRNDKNLRVELDGEITSFNLSQILTVDGKPFDNKAAVTEVSKEQINKDLAALTNVAKASQAKLEIIRSKSKKDAVKKFVEILGVKELMAKNFEQMLDNMHPNYRAQMRKVLNVDEIVDNLLPLYDKHFTQDELDYYIAFYSSPSGKKLQATIPLIMKESVDVNMEYLKDKMPKDIQ